MDFVKKLALFLLQGVIIFLFLLVGMGLSKLISPVILIPGSLLGMLLLTGALLAGVFKIKWISIFSDFMLKNMAFLFVPYGVTLLEQLDLVKAIWLPLLLICLISTLLVMLAAAGTTAFFIKRMHLREQSSGGLL